MLRNNSYVVSQSRIFFKPIIIDIRRCYIIQGFITDGLRNILAFLVKKKQLDTIMNIKNRLRSKKTFNISMQLLKNESFIFKELDQ